MPTYSFMNRCYAKYTTCNNAYIMVDILFPQLSTEGRVLSLYFNNLYQLQQ